MTAENFQHTEQRLKNAIAIVEAKLHTYKTESAKIVGKWTAQHQQQFKDWNLLHDLQDRLEGRLKDNYCNYQEWHFDKFGWCAY